MSETILFDALTVKRENTFVFDVWYANHYLPGALERSRFDTLRRYLSPIRGSYLALFQGKREVATEPSMAAKPAHDLVVSNERFIADCIGGRHAPSASEATLDAAILYPVFFKVPQAREQEFNAWYDEEHMEILQRCPYWPMCRRYRIRNPGEGFTHVALHYLTDLRALESAERDQARATPWRDRLAAEPWFKGEYRVYYRWERTLALGGG
ncbi:MAG: hypothetical protein IT531_03735 [Burkholderiales bacterium]|nr:hypothetical protein [Burkholderiales bacterium]